MLSFLVIFPNPFIQAKLVTTKTWLLCYMGVSHFHQFFLWNEVRKEKCGEIFAYPLQLPLTPKAQNMSNIYYLIPVINSARRVEFDLLWFSLIIWLYWWSISDQALTLQEFIVPRCFITSGMYNKLTVGTHKELYFKKQKPHPLPNCTTAI